MEASLSVYERLKSAAERGDIDMLYILIREEPYLLDHIDHVPFVDTPLHVAASTGHTAFAREIMLLKPSFAKKLNQDGFTPLHVALLKGQTKMVDRLLDADCDLVRVQGKEGKTAFHHAAKQGNVGLLKKFISSCPSSIEDVTNRSETALHIVVESKKFDAFCLLVGQLRTAVHKGSGIEEYKTLNRKNDSGNTVLHLAVKTHQPEVVEVLIANLVEPDVKNSDGLTALDILESELHSQVDNHETLEVIKEMLRRAKASKSSFFRGWKLASKYSLLPPTRISTRSTTTLTNVTSLNGIGDSNASTPPLTSNTVSNLNHHHNLEMNAIEVYLQVRYMLDCWIIDLVRRRNSLSEELRNMLLVVLVLLLTVAAQAILTPPGGFWQDDNSSKINHTATSNDNSSISHPPGTVIMGERSFLVYMIFASLVGVITVHVLIFLIQPDDQVEEPLWWLCFKGMLAFLIYLCYLISLHTVSHNVTIFLIITATTAIPFLLIPFSNIIVKRNLERRIKELLLME